MRLSSALGRNLMSLWSNDVQEAITNINATAILEKDISDKTTVSGRYFVEYLLRFDDRDFSAGMHQRANDHERRLPRRWRTIDRSSGRGECPQWEYLVQPIEVLCLRATLFDEF